MKSYILTFYANSKVSYKIECNEMNILKHIMQELEKGVVLSYIQEVN